jgi:tripartite-type tricarboxylate transporter receptor subunit TctC
VIAFTQAPLRNTATLQLRLSAIVARLNLATRRWVRETDRGRAAMRTGRILLVLLAAALVVPTARAEQDSAAYPTRPIRIVVGFAAGGGNDILARLVGQKLSEALGQSIVIENRPGANGELAADYVKNAAPDGYTLLVGASGMMSVSPVVNKKLTYAPIRDFTAIGMIASYPLVLVAYPAAPVRTVQDLVAYAKQNPDKANYAEPSVAFQVVVEQLKLKTGAPLQYIPYKSSAEALTAVMSGTTLATLIDSGPAVGAIKGGQVRGLAITSVERSSELPDVPTMTEAGFPDLSVSFWNGLFGPVGIPAPIARKLEAELTRAVKQPDMRERMRVLAVVPEGRPGEELRRLIAAEIARVGEVVRIANINTN